MLTKKIVLVTIFLFVLSPWVLRGGGDIYAGSFAQFLSFKLLFFDASIFQNIGKETGVVYPSFLPFAALGVFSLMKSGKISAILTFLVLLVISSVSPGQLIKLEFFVVVALLSYFAAIGLITVRRQKALSLRAVLWLGALGIIYEIGQYIHYIQIHYLQDMLTLGVF